MKKYLHILILLLAIFSLPNIYPQCNNSQGPRSSTIDGQNTSVGAFAWSTTGNTQASNDVYATNGVLLGILASGTTHYITVSGFGFTIPATAVICGIQVRVEKGASGLLIGSSIVDNSIRIIKNGVIVGNNLASGSGWSGTDAVAIYGNSSEVWGTTWTVAEVNASNFGVAISATLNAGLTSLLLTARIDHITITVFYSNPLPVELISFSSAQTDNRDYKLRWVTSSEINSDYYLVEESNDAIHWVQTDILDAAGNSNQILNYETNVGYIPHTTYYRLIQYDFDGTRNDLGMLSIDPHYDDVSVNYQPATNDLVVTFPSGNESATIEIIDTHGKQVKFSERQMNSLVTRINISDLAEHVFIVRVVTPNSSKVFKIMK